MSARFIVSLGVGALLLVLLGSLAFGDAAVGYYLAVAGVVVVIVAVRAVIRRRGEPPGGALAGR